MCPWFRSRHCCAHAVTGAGHHLLVPPLILATPGPRQGARSLRARGAERGQASGYQLLLRVVG